MAAAETTHFSGGSGTAVASRLKVLTAIERGGQPISSSRIRRLILLGQVRAASQLLGRDYVLRSTVEHGAERGRLMGYPTANLEDHTQQAAAGQRRLCGTGADRFSQVRRRAKRRLSAYFRRQYPDRRGLSLRLRRDLYDRLLTVSFVQRLRGEKRFASMTALQGQIARDVENAKRILA